MTTETQPADALRRSSLDLLIERADAAGIDTEVVSYEDAEEDDPGYVVLLLPNGRAKRRILVPMTRAARLLAHDFEQLRIVGDYYALLSESDDLIEVMLGSARGPGAATALALWKFPGAEVLDAKGEDSEELPEESEFTPGPRRPHGWRLKLDDGDRSVEISPPSDLMQGVWGTQDRMSLKLRGFQAKTHDEARSALTTAGSAMLFEIDMLYGVTLTMQRFRPPTRRSKRTAIAARPRFPKNVYSQESLALYEYGRSAAALPLLEFLAYYQSLEYFFPVFAREETVKAIRVALKNPLFDEMNDEAVNRLINLATPAGRSGLAEKDQLRATVRGCVAIDELEGFFQSSEYYMRHFCTAKQVISGVVSIKMKGDQADLRDQVADRIYAIRCRVVHAKQDGKGDGEELLLPSSPEVEALAADIDLLRFVAQRALCARATRRSR